LSFDLVINNGLVVRPEGSSRTNIGITNGVIAAISNEALTGREVIDATGLVVMPGAVLEGGGGGWCDHRD
jgi:dihydroorotase-like cyclic amidohydrolase